MGPWLLRLLCAALLVAGLDLLIAVLRGYALRTERLALAGLELAGVALLALPGPALLALVGRRLRPWLGDWAGGLLAAALGPLAASYLWLGRGSTLALAAGAGASAAVLALLERHAGRRSVAPALACGLLAAGLTTVALMRSAPARLATFEAPAAAPVAARPTGPNLLVVVLDTLRADHVGAYGYPRDTTPWLDGFARRARLFEHVTAPSSYTLPSHASLFTGLYPAAHGADVSEADAGLTLRELGLQADVARVLPLSQDAHTLAERLRERGYETGAVCANTAYLARHFQLDQGFDTYVDTVPVETWRRPFGLRVAAGLFARGLPRVPEQLLSNERYYLLAPEVNDLALRWLAPRRERPFFLFLNYMDAHAPYLPIGAWAERFRDQPPPRTAADRPHPGDPPALSEAAYLRDVNAYDAEIRYLDDHLRLLFEQLEAWRLLEDTVVVFASDHGESFGEHGRVGHAVGIFEPEVRVPLVLHAPGLPGGVRISERASLVDVLPTVLELLSAPVPDGLHGIGLLRPAAPRPVPITAHLGRYERELSETAVYRAEAKLLERSDGGSSLFDLATDPEERHDLTAERPGVRAALAELLARFEAAVTPRFAKPDGAIDDDTRRRLEALGYAR